MRYIKYFETFLNLNISRPYIKMIPKIIANHITPNTTNIIKNYLNDKTYFISGNSFMINNVKIGPVKNANSGLKFEIKSLVESELNFENVKITMKEEEPYTYIIVNIKYL
jgi:hypothetical protein